MSQATFLDYVHQWTENECKERLEETLPKLILYCNSLDSKEKFVSVFKLLCNSFLPHIEHEKLGIQFFSSVILKTIQMFGLSLDSIKESALLELQLDEKNDVNVEKVSSDLHAACDIIECLEFCVIHTISNVTDVSFKNITNLPEAVLQILKDSYGHCKDSANIYGNLITGTYVAESLSLLFKKAHGLQVAFLSLLEKLKLDKSLEDDVANLAAVCYGLYEICQVVSILDVKLMAALWKSFSRLTSAYRDVLKDHLDFISILKYLCNQIEETLQHMTEIGLSMMTNNSQGDEKEFLKNIKVTGFNMRLLVSLVEKFNPSIGSDVPEVIQLIFSAQKYSINDISNLTLPQNYSEEIHKQIIPGLEPLIYYLMNDEGFIKAVTEINFETENYFSVCIIQLTVLTKLSSYPDDVQLRWLFPGDKSDFTIFDVIFHSLENCFLELSLPIGVPECKGNSFKNFNLYEFACSRMSNFIDHLCTRHFQALEMSLLKSVLRDIYCSLLAVDLFCIIARLSSPEVCYNQVVFLLNLIIKIPVAFTLQWYCLRFLLLRLVTLLSTDYQESLLEAFPIEKHVKLCSILPMTSLKKCWSKNQMEIIILSCSRILENWIAQNKVTTILPEVFTALPCLINIISFNETNQSFSSQHLTHMLNIHSQLWQLINVDMLISPAEEWLVCNLIDLTAILTTSLPSKDFNEILNLMCCLCKKNQTLQLKVSNFLKSLGKVFFPSSLEQGHILSSISQLFVTLMSSNHLLIHQEALEAFSQFAHMTSHESVIHDCIREKPALQNIITNYLKKLPYQVPEEFLWSRSEFLQHQSKVLKNNFKSKALSLNTRNITRLQLASSCEELQVKRIKTDLDGHLCQGENAYLQAVKNIRENVQVIQNLMKTTPSPEWLYDNLHTIHSQLGAML